MDRILPVRGSQPAVQDGGRVYDADPPQVVCEEECPVVGPGLLQLQHQLVHIVRIRKVCDMLPVTAAGCADIAREWCDEDNGPLSGSLQYRPDGLLQVELCLLGCQDQLPRDVVDTVAATLWQLCGAVC